MLRYYTLHCSDNSMTTVFKCAGNWKTQSMQRSRKWRICQGFCLQSTAKGGGVTSAKRIMSLFLICTLLHNSASCLQSEAAPVSLLRKRHNGELTGSELLGIRLVLRLQQHKAKNLHTGNTHLQSTAINSYCLTVVHDLEKPFTRLSDQPVRTEATLLPWYDTSHTWCGFFC